MAPFLTPVQPLVDVLVHGPASAALLLVTGRTAVALEHLDGEGAEELRTRVPGDHPSVD